MTDITPPPELVQQWLEELFDGPVSVISPFDQRVLIAVAQWGADQELEAIQKEIITQAWFADPRHRLAQLRAARRPEPPSLKEQALHELAGVYNRDEIDDAAYDIIRRALEQLP